MTVTFLPSGLLFEAGNGMTIMEAARAAGLRLDAPCGGNGTCKKCKVRMRDAKGEREVLACQTVIRENITVELPESDEGHRILMGGISREVSEVPSLQILTLTLPKPTTADLRPCWERLRDALAERTGIEKTSLFCRTTVISSLYTRFESCSYTVDAVLSGNEVLDVIPVGAPVLGAAFDIGTTTVACYLLDLRSGKQIGEASLLNPQVTYGGDVIMRVKYCVENGTDGPTGDIRAALNKLLLDCAAKSGAAAADIRRITIVGNTCMHHLFLGINPASLAYAPYTPAVAEPLRLSASDYGFTVHAAAELLILPNIAGFVGADTVGAALAASMDEKKEITLLIDIGTNGEMVLGTKDHLVACSTAAGPAFEGALISCGMRGAEGAIDHVSLSDGKLKYSVIGGGKPTGICGSGLIDLLSELVRVGLVESGGRLIQADEAETEEARLLSERIFDLDGFRAFLLATPEESANGKQLSFTQKDVREVQLAKGAMAAGIQMMCRRLGIETNDIRSVMIAGAFGSYMSPESACGIGLIPPELREEVCAIGNAAGQGAKLCALSAAEYERAAVLASSMDYLELAADPAFQDVFVDELEFPEP